MRILDPEIEVWAVENGVDMGVVQRAVSSFDLPVWRDWRGKYRISPAVGHAWLAGWRAGDRQGYRRGHNAGLREVSRRDHAIGFGRGHDEGHAYGREEGIRLGHEAGYRKGLASRLPINIRNIQPLPESGRFH